MLCEKKESLIRKGLLRNQQSRFFMNNARRLVDLITDSNQTIESIMETADSWISEYDPEWYQLSAQLPEAGSFPV